MANSPSACPVLILLSGEGGVLLTHPGPEFFGTAPQTLLDLARCFHPFYGGRPEPFAPELFRRLGPEGICTELRLPGRPSWEGRLTAHRWKEVPGGARTLLCWQPEVRMEAGMDPASRRIAGRVRGLMADARNSLRSARDEGSQGELHLEHLLLLFERAEGLLAFLAGEDTAPGGIEAWEAASH